MPVKRVDDLKNATDKFSGQEWQKFLNLRDLTTREWNHAAEMYADGKSIREIVQVIRNDRSVIKPEAASFANIPARYYVIAAIPILIAGVYGVYYFMKKRKQRECDRESEE